MMPSMSIEVSVIMITYNKYPQNKYSLYAIENQTFDLEKIEVILVDDASTDKTIILQNYRPPFNFKYIRCEHNVGRSKAKNIGIEAATGKILILLDAEMILDPSYIEQHYNLHQTDPNLVLTGCLRHYNTFTVLDKKYNKDQNKIFKRLYRRKKYHKLLFNRFQKQKSKIKMGMFTKKSIFQRKYKKYAYHAPFYKKIIRQYGSQYEGFYLPYIFVITHNISIRRSTIDSVGLFDEGFQGWGCEDWEFGYRLYKHGVRIIDNPNVKIYHQEHPRKVDNQLKDSLINLKYFFTKHREFDVGVQSLCFIGKNMFEVNELVIEYRELVQVYSKQYQHFIQVFLILFENIFTVLIQGKAAKRLMLYNENMQDQKWKHALYMEMNLLKASGEYPKLIATLDWLIRL